MRMPVIAAVSVVTLAGLASSEVLARAAPAPPASTPTATAAAALASPAASPAPKDDALPPSEEDAKARLDRTPRHGELVDVKLPSGASMRTWIAYPERKDKAPIVLVIHEIYGLSDWIRAVADQLAREGFIAVAPDLVSGFGPGGGGTDSVEGRDTVVQLVRSVTLEETVKRLDAARAWALRLPSASGKTATVGFCWGGGRSFEYAAAQPALGAAVVFYGTSPEPPQLARIKAPVLGHYGGDDSRVDATIPPAETEMKKLGKTFEPHVYDGAGHGFLRMQNDRDGKNRAATAKAWPRTIAFLREHLK